MKTISAVVVAKNEEEFVRLCLEHLEPFVDEIIFVDNGSSDKTKEIASSFTKVKMFDFQAEERVDMGKVRNFSIAQATGDWILQVDCDEIYPESEMLKVRKFIDETDAISARVHYKNLAWRSGYAQKEFGHYPDRLYRRDVIEGYFGMLPNDMMKVKSEHLLAPAKKSGDIGVLEYDNEDDRSFVHPKQPIIDVTYFHLARTRGYNFEYNKWKRYNRNLHPTMPEDELEGKTRINNWVSGLYEMEPVLVPDNIPKKTIKNPKVSVIITNFNYEEYVEQAINSVLKQTYPAHEIIVVDDYSGDNSLQKISQFPVTTIVARTHNGGPGAARNDGIARSTGDYFICLDADDRLRPNALERLVAEIGDAEVAYPDMEMFGNRNGVRMGVWQMPDYTPERMLEAQCVPSVCALIERHAFDCSGGFDHRSMYEDWDFFLNLSEKLKLNFKHVPEVLLEYRAHEHSRSRFNDANQQVAYGMLRDKYPNIKV